MVNNAYTFNYVKNCMLLGMIRFIFNHLIMFKTIISG